ncbi:protein translocase subunit SecD [Candidatus Bodocaedibacter vickermanii]|uniref:Protein translocase subunit SecD n=1 Tax=Candidatus Bodocaedibacter vickermanii TaxID=2741701 RepID=A0A7L9RUD9_9PROT|nr:protein translocase subunit SecD [Candidatus Paracaedibacteraceae bacterium 'Lake Konstanz']
MSGRQKWKNLIVYGVCFLGTLFMIPNFLSEDQLAELPEFLRTSQMRLGLDLQGGSYLQLQVDMSSAVQDRFAGYADEVRILLRQKKISFSNLTIVKGESPSVVFEVLNDQDAAKAEAELNKLPNMITRVDGKRLTTQLRPHDLLTLRQSIINQSISIISRRVDQLGTTEPEVTAQGTDRIVVQLPGLKDPERVKGLINKTAKLTFHKVEARINNVQAQNYRATPGTRLIAEDEGLDGIPTAYYVISQNPVLTGDNLIDAQQGYDTQHNQAIVSFQLDGPGGRKFADVTRELALLPKDDPRKQFAMVLDNKIISAPAVQSEIPNGQGQITGNFTIQSANDLAVLMRAGALPATLSIMEEKTIGPSLGSDSIKAGQFATILSITAVMIAMAVLYGVFGLIADIALLFNTILLLAGLSIMEATLTLPGIAGIALTIGMAVDANVLIFERLREELKAGKKPQLALALGYDKAMATIIDANITTIMGALLLFWFGTGPIRGFAITLCLGISVSMFTAIMLTRLISEKWIDFRKNKPVTI